MPRDTLLCPNLSHMIWFCWLDIIKTGRSILELSSMLFWNVKIIAETRIFIKRAHYLYINYMNWFPYVYNVIGWNFFQNLLFYKWSIILILPIRVILIIQLIKFLVWSLYWTCILVPLWALTNNIARHVMIHQTLKLYILLMLNV